MLNYAILPWFYNMRCVLQNPQLGRKWLNFSFLKITTHIGFLCLTMLWSNLIWAQSSSIINFNKQDYKAANQNWSLVVGANKYLFAANNEGLLSYDGTRWLLHQLPQKTVIRSVAVDTNNRIYIGSYQEFGYYVITPTGDFIYTSLISKLQNYQFHNDEIWKIVIIGNNVYFQSFSSIFIFDGEKVEMLQPPGNIVFLLKARNRLFVHVIGKGLFELVNKKYVPIAGSEKYLTSDVRVVLPFGEQDYLIGTAADGMFVWDGEGFSPLQAEVNQQLKKYQVNCGVATASSLVIGTIVNGLFILDKRGNLIEHLHTANSLQNNTVLALEATKTGNIWVGLDKGIDHILFDLPLSIYPDKTAKMGASYTAALFNNVLYLGTNQGVLSFTPDSLGYYHNMKFEENTQGQVWTLKVIDSTLFCGHNEGTFKWVNAGFQKVSWINGGYNLKEVVSDNKNFLLQSTYTKLVVFDKKNNQWQTGRAINTFIEPIPYLETDYQNNIWASHTYRGIYRIKLNAGFTEILKATYMGKNEGFPSDYNLKVFKVQNRIIFTTSYKLYTWDDISQKIIPYDKLNNQLNGFENCHKIVPIANDLYWLLRRDEIALFKINEQVVKQIFKLQPSQYNLFMVENFENIVPLNDSIHLLCLDEGFALLNTNRITNNFVAKRNLQFTAIKAFNNNGLSKALPIKSTKIVVLNYQFNSLSFSFTDFSYHTKQKRFWYRLTGLSEKWTEWRSSDSLVFSRLPAKQYMFEVKAENSDGSFSEPLSYIFIINRPKYLSVAAITGYIFLVIFLIVVIRFRFAYRLKKHSAELKAQEAEKLQHEQQKATQEIMSLQYEKLQAELSHKTVQVANSTMAIIKKNELLNAISNELEKQKIELGNRYPNKLYTQLKKLIDSNISTEDDWQMFQAHFDLAHEHFFQHLKNDFPNLTQGDLNLCALLRMNLSSKEIAQLLNITNRGVEIRRYRLRKRLNIPTDINLTEFILKY